MIRDLDWDAALGQPVRIYRNLNNGRMSIQQRVAGRWIVVGHITDCVIENVEFFISESGRQRVIRDRTKNVHAWGQGVLIAQFNPKIIATVDLGYDPYRHATFVERNSDRPIENCRYLVVRDNHVSVSADAVSAQPPLQLARSVNFAPQLALFFRPLAAA